MSRAILLVEDEAEQAGLLTGWLRESGHRVHHCANLSAAERALGEHEFDLVICDLFLPDGDGLAFCRTVRQTQVLPVVMVSSLEPEFALGVTERSDGPQAFFSKPFRPRELLGVVANLLNCA